MSVPFDQNKKPVKGILKNTSSFDTKKSSKDHRCSLDKEMKWDEMNILATYHPANKDYGHDKINEPSTPYNRCEVDGVGSGDEDEDSIDPQLLVDSLTMTSKPKLFNKVDSQSDDDDDDEEEDETSLTEEQKEHKEAFKVHRKQHYNEFQAVQLARKLLQEEEEEEGGEKEKEEDGEASSSWQPPATNNDVDMETAPSE